nr:F287 [uncultured bacterium]
MEEQRVDLLQQNEARCAWVKHCGWPKDISREPIATIVAP